MNSILKKYSSHPSLDPVKVLEKLPKDWKLKETG